MHQSAPAPYAAIHSRLYRTIPLWCSRGRCFRVIVALVYHVLPPYTNRARTVQHYFNLMLVSWYLYFHYSNISIFSKDGLNAINTSSNSKYSATPTETFVLCINVDGKSAITCQTKDLVGNYLRSDSVCFLHFLRVTFKLLPIARKNNISNKMQPYVTQL